MHLVIRDLSKTYPNGTQALKDVSLDVPQGMFGLLGRNGAGTDPWRKLSDRERQDNVVGVEAAGA